MSIVTKEYKIPGTVYTIHVEKDAGKSTSKLYVKLRQKDDGEIDLVSLDEERITREVIKLLDERSVKYVKPVLDTVVATMISEIRDAESGAKSPKKSEFKGKSGGYSSSSSFNESHSPVKRQMREDTEEVVLPENVLTTLNTLTQTIKDLTLRIARLEEKYQALERQPKE